MACVEIKKPGWLTTIQDLGRWGLQRYGVSVSGPMDLLSHRLANLLAGNAVDAATLEVTLGGLELVFDGDAWFAATGADLSLTLNGEPVEMNRALHARPGDGLRFGLRRRGARSYLAVAGGFVVPMVLGSRSTHVLSGLGGLKGRPLRAGDRLDIGQQDAPVDRKPRAAPFAVPEGGTRLRVMPGPHQDRFEALTVERLPTSRYVLSDRSNRVGYRLEGESMPWAAGTTELISTATVPGGVQVPASGQPILLMADCAPTGGYPMIAVVISADVPLAGQLAPGDWLEFVRCTREEAVAALQERERSLEPAC